MPRLTLLALLLAASCGEKMKNAGSVADHFVDRFVDFQIAKFAFAREIPQRDRPAIREFPNRFRRWAQLREFFFFPAKIYLLAAKNCRAVAKPLPQRCFEQRVVIDAIEDVVGGSLGDASVDAGAFDVHADAEFAAALDRSFGAGNRGSDPCVVDGALVPQARDRFVDEVGIVALSGEALTDLMLGQLAACEHLQAVEIRGVNRQTS